ncbi:MAG: C-type lectin domain-containing protein [bacterium]|nr:C-type lectin domain-containing protein [bacterium]
MRIKVLVGIFLLAGAAFFASGCGGSSNKTGQGPAGIASATVCLDLNDNYVCDTGEPATQTDETGAYSMVADKSDLKKHRVLWTVDDDTVDSATGAALQSYYTLASVIGSPWEVSAFTTILSVQTAVNEKALKASLGITEKASLLGGYSPDGQIASFGGRLNKLYALFYATASDDASLGTSGVISQVVDLLITQSAAVIDYVNTLEAKDRPPANATFNAPVVDSDALFKNIPIDASTMSWGVGLNEVSRQVVPHGYCLSVTQESLVPVKTFCENTGGYNFRLVKTVDELADILNVGGRLSVDVSSANFNASLEGRFINEMKQNTSSVFALITADFRLCGYALETISMDTKYMSGDSLKASYTDNYEQFRVACGDRFLSSIVTGGTFYGLLRMDTSDASKKRDLTAKLEGKFAGDGFSIGIEGDMHMAVTAAVKDQKVTILFGSRGVSPTYLGADTGLIQNVDQFFKAATGFMKAIADPNNPCNNSKTAWRECALAATFADYATVSRATMRNVSQVKYMNYINSLMMYYGYYKQLESELSYLTTHSKLYKNNLAAKSKTVADMMTLLNDVSRAAQDIHDAYADCLTNDSYAVCSVSPKAGFAADAMSKYIDRYKLVPLPDVYYPQNCLEIQRIYDQDSTDVTVFLGHDPAKPYTVACANMDSSEPETYLTLQTTSSITSPGSNSAVDIAAGGGMVATAYDMFKIKTNYNNVEVINNQQFYQDTTDPPGPTMPVNLGTAKDCNRSNAWSIIDLTGPDIPFVLDTSLASSFKASRSISTQYIWVSEEMTFPAAVTYATNLGYRLVEFDDAIEFANLRQDVLLNHPNTNSWVALRRKNNNSPLWQQMQWYYSGNYLTEPEWKTYFHSGEPNNCGGDQKCSVFWADGLLDDQSCMVKHPFYMKRFIPGLGSIVSNVTPTGTKKLQASVSGSAVGICEEIRPTIPVRFYWE